MLLYKLELGPRSIKFWKLIVKVRVMTQPVKWPKIPLNYLESGQVHDMFKLTYNQVRQFIKKSVLYDMRSYVESGLGARITSLLVATFFMIPLVMIVGIGTTISLDNLFGINIPLLSKIFVPIFIIIGSLSELGFLISVFIPRKNIAEFGLRSDIIWSSPKCWCKLNSANLSFHKLKHTGFFWIVIFFNPVVNGHV